MTPSNLGTLWDTVNSTTIIGQSNGGLTGIFKKANRDVNFRVDAQDIVGRWKCEKGDEDVRYGVREDPNVILADPCLPESAL